MKEKSFEEKREKLYVDLRRQLKRIKVKQDKFDALALLIDMIDVVYDLYSMEDASRRRFFNMIGIVEVYLKDGQDMRMPGTEVRKDFHETALAICNDLYDEICNGKL